MRIFTQVCRFLVGLLFIFSGLIKLNDPYGFSYKLQEYFEVFASDFGAFFHSFTPYALAFSLFISILEIVLGVAVLIFYRMRITTWILLLMIIFFTFLTFYSAYFEKVKECGCFGDFIRLTPWESFSKDVFLLILILVLFIRKNYLKAGFNNIKGDLIIAISTLICVFSGYYVLEHLPLFDWRPYAVGKNIQIQRTPEENPQFIYIMEKDGKNVEMEAFPTDPSYKYISYKILNPEKSQPKIMDYQIWNEEGDFTDSSLIGDKLFIVIKDAEKALHNKAALSDLKKIQELLTQLEEYSVKPMVLTSSPVEKIEDLRHEVQLAAPYYYMDDTQLKTMIRANVGLLLLENGTIKGKWHHNDVPDVEKVKKLLKKN